MNKAYACSSPAKLSKNGGLCSEPVGMAGGEQSTLETSEIRAVRERGGWKRARRPRRGGRTFGNFLGNGCDSRLGETGVRKTLGAILVHFPAALK